MAARTKKKTTRPRPPDDLSEPATLEFHRIVDVLESEGRLATADPAIITLYAETWSVYRAAAKEVAKGGAVLVHPNNISGISPHLRVMKELGRQVRGLLNDLGLTPSSRLKGGDEAEEDDLEY